MKVHLQANPSLSFLALVSDRHRQNLGYGELISHSSYLEEPYYCCLKLGKDLADPRLWKSSVSSEGTVSGEGGRE